MELLSLQGAGPPPVDRPTRAEAVMISVAAHVLIFLFLIYVPERLPEGIRRLFQGLAVTALPANGAARPDERNATEASKPEPAPRPPEQKIPLKFAYVRVPEDAAPLKNPQARLFSDRDRRARQEVPTPPDARRLTTDPHSEGNSRDRIRLDPSRPEGPDALDPAPPPAGSEKAGGSPGATGGRAPGPEGTSLPVEEPRTVASVAGVGAPAPEPPPEEAAGSAGLPSASGPDGGAATEGEEGLAGDPSPQAPPDLQGRTEYKFSFNNPGWLRGQAIGTLSFDTQGFPWGDYARQLYVIIRNNWLARIPPAADFVRGYTCQHFTIERDGTISGIDIVRLSSHPPFNRVASDALRASSPLPPLPAEFPKEREGVTGCFYYNMYPDEAE